MNRHELPLDGWIIQERVLCHRLESTSRLPAPAACTPLETNQYISIATYEVLEPHTKYSSTAEKYKNEKQRRGFELTLCWSRIERSTAEPKKRNVVITCRLQEGNFEKSSLAEFGCDARSFAGDREGCCVGSSWRGRAVSGDRMALGTRS